MSILKAISSGAADIRAAFGLVRLWVMLAREEIGDQHRGTLLGPIWLLLNYLSLAATFIFVFHRNETSPTYAVYVAVGLWVWFHFMEVVTASTSLFRREEGLIKGTTLPLSVYVLRLATQQFVRAGYALLGCAAIIAISGAEPSQAWAFAIVGVAFVILVTVPMIVIISVMGVIFPDSQYIFPNAMRIGMFLTPIFWVYDKSSSSIQSLFYEWNPFVPFLNSIRQPFVGAVPPYQDFGSCAVLTAMGWFVALYLLGSYRHRIVFLV